MKNKISIQITSGRGPAECCWVVAQLVKVIIKRYNQDGLSCKVIDKVKGTENGTLQSAVLLLEGAPSQLEAFVSEWQGSILWTGKSMYRKFHKRKNWFVGINAVKANAKSRKISPKDLHIEATRGSGPGGQHKNKVSTAIRVTHRPSGISVLAADNRSQAINKKNALARLEAKLEHFEMEQLRDHEKANWAQHTQLERGNPTKTFKGKDFQEC